MKWNYKNLVKWLNPQLKVGGLEISDGSLKFLSLNEAGEITSQINQPLTAGIVQAGKVVDEPRLVAALQQFKAGPVIVSLSSANVYTQVFNLPYLEGEKLEEAARLNLKMVSPLDPKTSYADWQVLGTTVQGLEVLGAFVGGAVVDGFVRALKTAGFTVVAIEFFALSLIRAITYLPGLDLTKSYLVLSLTGDGMNFSILRSSQLYFNYFISWQTVQEKAGGGQVTFVDFEKLMIGELRRLINFSNSKWGTSIKDLLLVSLSPTKAVTQAIKKEFTLAIEELVDVQWLAVSGAARRGLVPRAEDHFISLTSVGTEEEFHQQRLGRFVNLWRNVALGAAAIISLLFLFSDLLFVRHNRRLEEQLMVASQGVNQEELARLEAEAKEFNQLVDKALAAKNRDQDWAAILQRVQTLAGSEVTISQLRLEPATALISLVGVASNERASINFKNRLAKEPKISNLSFPLSAIKIEPTGRASFSATFRIAP